MWHLALLVLLLASACRHTFEERPDAPPTGCDLTREAADLTTIKTYVFEPHCNGGSCHRDSSQESELHLQGNAHAELVNVTSDVDPAYKLVVPGEPRKSYILFMLKAIPAAELDPPPSYTEPPDDVEFMPVDFTICKEKVDAVRRWIEAGAPDN